ncbi:glycosyltransferase family 4 protein [Candidatus Bathyarchaeota archaeon]|nr:glycosyltransferase family 4 protein [Candidatus Bathyarchaeota archaeon]
MQVAIFSPGFPPSSIGGEEYYAYYQAKELLRMGNAVYVIANGDKNENCEQTFFEAINLQLIEPAKLRNSFIRYALVAAKFAFSFLRLKVRPNVIHGHDPYGEGLAAVLVGKILNVPVVITWHAAELMENNAHFSFVGNVCRLVVLRGAGRVIVNSSFFEKLAFNFVGYSGLSSKTRVVSPGVDIDEFSLKNDIKDLRNSLAGESDFIVLSVCRLEKIKGLDTLLRSIPSVLESIPNVKFVILGSGTELQFLTELSKKLNIADHICFAGNISRSLLPRYYSACDVFVIPTKGEGFGMAYLEAWSCCKPIIVTPYAPEIAKLVSVYGGGIIVGDNSFLLSNAIIRLLSSKTLRSEMGLIGRNIAESKYSWKKTASDNFQVYKELCSN